MNSLTTTVPLKKVVQKNSRVTPIAPDPRSAPAAANQCPPAASTLGLASTKPCRSPLRPHETTRSSRLANKHNPSPSTTEV